MIDQLLHWKYRVNGPVAWKGGGTQTTVQQNYSPEESAQRAQVGAEAQRIYQTQAGNNMAVGVPLVATPSQYTQQANTAALQTIPGAQQQTSAAQSANMGLLNAADVNANPWLQGYGQSLGNLLLGQNAAEYQLAGNQIGRQAQQLGAQMNTGANQLATQVAPSIRGDFVQNGQYGSTRQGIAEGIAGSRLADQFGQGWQSIINNAGASQDALLQQQAMRSLGAQNQVADLYKTGYGQGLNAVQSGINNLPTLQNSSLYPSQILGTVGQQQDAYTQNLLNADAQRQVALQNAPWQQLNNYANIVYGGSNPQTVSQNITPPMSPWAGAAAGAMSGAYLGSQVYPGYGTAIGAVLGGIGGYFA